MLEILHEQTIVIGIALGAVFLGLAYLTYRMCVNGKPNGYRVSSVSATLVLGLLDCISIIEKIKWLTWVSSITMVIGIITMLLLWRNPDIRPDDVDDGDLDY
ncbi:MAG: hypothetical protein UR96_C0023G0006 [candidate division WS6 bacterium GW2011_GWC1_36_11]|uniref:Uncharacterized protein n=2 Tax=Candidatus Dojkabacteria TaxID=74243 RepID=A0A0G0FX95_9BACT|nr:MAG: hypothetical protein UR96_C0023G0006 [candidate division WS6 bacterium GW2011_GWC1_36_11]KKQ03964.1 MAG: hypothetical protein US14_C0028G0001 [candidate division WS6 bacterium GW2011_WS6_36_26]KKQ10976.1 MAG: hypothetical protein US23_C0015G0002 [candidate division WS6 bacterium GW2011_GWE1_36_69]KKQ15854.1 MAG: hypothetical protein US29_C0035G0001 [candidate division WS6 bacterium GW2011_GWF1_36_8]HAM37613.1 hypothetical protein [Patescibacteria group bacterium]